MAAPGNLHSQVVGWLKILLPLTALALLSTLFLFARQTGAPTAIPASEIDAIAREQGIGTPRITGVADDGSVIEIAADTVRPLGEAALQVAAPRLALTTTDGTSLTIRAGEAEVDETARTARLTGLARLDTSTGYSMETRGLLADLKTGEVTSLGPLEVQAPYGRLTAGAVRIHVTDTGTGQQMDFTRGVKLVYDPARPPALEGQD